MGFFKRISVGAIDYYFIGLNFIGTSSQEELMRFKNLTLEILNL